MLEQTVTIKVDNKRHIGNRKASTILLKPQLTGYLGLKFSLI